MPKKSIPKILPLSKPPVNIIRQWREDSKNTYEKWKKKADAATDPLERDSFMARAYVCDDGFYHYCHDILGFEQMHPPFHGRMARLVVGSSEPRNWNVKQVRKLEAFRKSFKSSMASAGYPTWLIAREYILCEPVRRILDEIAGIKKQADSDERPLSPEEQKWIDGLQAMRKDLVEKGKSLDGVNIRIGLQSEELNLPTQHLEACTRVMDSEIYIRYFGQHGPQDRRKGAKWGANGATSVFRTNVLLKEPTIWTISIDAPRIGRHFDVIIADDLQAETMTQSKDQLNKCWHLYRLNFSLLNSTLISNYAELLIACTRWHHDDIYGRIDKENDKRAKEDRCIVLTMPVCNEAKVANCPTIYQTEHIAGLITELGINNFNTQMLLRPTTGDTQSFHPDWMKWYSPLELARRLDTMNTFVGVDFCWVEASRRNDQWADHSVVLTIAVDEQWRVYLIDAFRKQCTRNETISEAARQYKEHGAIACGMSVSDRKYVESDLDRFFYDTGDIMNIMWISDLTDTSGVAAETNKARKHIGVLQPMFMQGKIHIPYGFPWLEEELLNHPRGATDDGLDSLVCAVKVSSPSVGERSKEYKPIDPWERHIESTLKGRPVDLSGRPILTESVQRRQGRYRFRRARAKILS